MSEIIVGMCMVQRLVNGCVCHFRILLSRPGSHESALNGGSSRFRLRITVSSQGTVAKANQ